VPFPAARTSATPRHAQIAQGLGGLHLNVGGDRPAPGAILFESVNPCIRQNDRIALIRTWGRVVGRADERNRRRPAAQPGASA
jgi:hypothetical protein